MEGREQRKNNARRDSSKRCNIEPVRQGAYVWNGWKREKEEKKRERVKSQTAILETLQFLAFGKKHPITSSQALSDLA